MEKHAYFENSSGRKLHGVAAIPEAADFPLVIICHGYASNTESKTRVSLAQQLLRKNVASLGFDFTGCGKSEGKLYELTVSQGLEDLKAAHDYAKNIGGIDRKRIGLLGSSFSGSVAVLFAFSNEIKALALKSPVSDYGEIREVPLVAKTKQRQFFDDAAKHDIYEAAGKIKIPTIIVHGSDDADVPAHQSKRLFERLSCEKRLEIINWADHRYSDEKHFSLLVKLVSQWFEKHL